MSLLLRPAPTLVNSPNLPKTWPITMLEKHNISSTYYIVGESQMPRKEPLGEARRQILLDLQTSLLFISMRPALL